MRHRLIANGERSCHDNNKAHCACPSVRINKCGNLKRTEGEGERQSCSRSFCSPSLALFVPLASRVNDILSHYPGAATADGHVHGMLRGRCFYRAHERRHILGASSNRASANKHRQRSQIALETTLTPTVSRSKTLVCSV